MFTGLVEATGRMVTRRVRGPGAVLEIACPFGPLTIGESIAVDGACLTVTRTTGAGFEADVSAETLERTTLGALGLGAAVNLERSLPAGGRLGGHLVTGHVDGVGSLVTREPLGEATKMTFAFPARLAALVAEKGSIAIAGVSLTVNAVRDGFAAPAELDVVIVPHTAQATSLGGLRPSDPVNVEVDLVARYVARLLTAPRVPQDGLAYEPGADAKLLEGLKRSGYL
jgi:riboflavin synthase